MEDKVVFIVPGFGDLPEDKQYLEVASFFKAQGITPNPVKIFWKRKTMSSYIQQFTEQYSKVKAQKIYFFGFSFGSMIAFICATKLKVDELVLCSLSPHFKEDLPNWPKTWVRLNGKKRNEDSLNFSYTELAPKIKAKITLLIGTEEGKPIQKAYQKLYPLLKSPKKIVKVEGVKHELENPKYVQAVEEVVKKL